MFHAQRAGSALAAIAALAALSGCVSFGGKPPSQLLSLSAEQKVAPGATRAVGSEGSLIVADPEAPRMLDTVRVPVQVSPTSVAYVAKVQWADTPRHLFQRLLSETIAATTGRMVLDPGQYAGVPSQRLMGEIVDFSIDAQRNSAVVTFDAILAGPNGQVIAKQRFTATAPVSGKIDAATVGGPLNSAANRVATDIATWLATAGRQEARTQE